MTEAPTSRNDSPVDYLLELDSLRVGYESRPTPVLKHITLSLKGGETVSLIGPNGSGKSTLLRAAAALLRPTGGVVRLAGKDAQLLSRREVGRIVAFVQQAPERASGFRVVDVIAMGRAPYQGTWMRSSPEDRSAVESALHRCSLDSLATRRVDTLSGGELQRVCIARALAQQPRVLLLDEPAAFLDIHHRRDFELLLKEVVASERIACLIAMHDLDAARRTGSRVALLHEGRFLALGSSEDVITPELVQRAFGLHGGFLRERADPENAIEGHRD